MMGLRYEANGNRPENSRGTAGEQQDAHGATSRVSKPCEPPLFEQSAEYREAYEPWFTWSG